METFCYSKDMKTVSLANHFLFAGFTMRSAEPADILPIVAIINRAYSYQDAFKSEPRTDPEHLAGRVAETDFYVIETNQQLVGCVYLEPKERALHFGLLTVVPQHRSSGLAPAIMQAIETCAKAESFSSINFQFMSVAPWLEAYYQKYGFTRTGEVSEWGTIDLVGMSKAL